MFYVAKFPSFDWTEQREAQLRATLNEISEGGWSGYIEYHLFEDENRDTAKEDFVTSVKIASSTEQNDCVQKFCEYGAFGGAGVMNITGFLGQRNAPDNDIYDDFVKACWFAKVWDICVNWSCDDFYTNNFIERVEVEDE